MSRDAPCIVKCFLEERLSLLLDDKTIPNSACSGHRDSESVSIRKRTKLGSAGEGSGESRK